MKCIYMFAIEQQMIYLSYLIVHCPLSTILVFAIAHGLLSYISAIEKWIFFAPPFKNFSSVHQKFFIANTPLQSPV